MTWIETHRPDDAHPEFRDVLRRLSKLLPPEYSKASSTRVPEAVRRESIVRAHSLLPEVAEHVLRGHAALLDPSLALSRRDQELISTVVSAANGCFY